MYTGRNPLETCSNVVHSNNVRGDLIHAPSGSGMDPIQEVLLTTDYTARDSKSDALTSYSQLKQ
jgi:hypothetical protein